MKQRSRANTRSLLQAPQATPANISRVQAAKADLWFYTLVDVPAGDYELVSSTSEVEAALKSEALDNKFLRVSGTPFLEFASSELRGVNFTIDCKGAAIDIREARLIRSGPARDFAFYNCVLFTVFRGADVSAVAQRIRFLFVNCHTVGACKTGEQTIFTGPNMPVSFPNSTAEFSPTSILTLSNSTTRCLEPQELDLLMDALGRRPTTAAIQGTSEGSSSQSDSVWMAAAAASATVLLILLVALVVWCVHRGRRRHLQDDTAAYALPPPTSLPEQQRRSISFMMYPGDSQAHSQQHYDSQRTRSSTQGSVASDGGGKHTSHMIARQWNAAFESEASQGT